MEILIKELHKFVQIDIEYREIKRVHLKVFPDMTIRLSVPFGISNDWIANFIEKKRNWIGKCIQKFAKTTTTEKETTIKSGVSTRILGRQLTIKVNSAKIYKIEKNDLTINIFSPNYKDNNSLMRQYNHWWQKESKQYFEIAIDKLYPIIEKHGICKPSLMVKKMKTLWGSCSRKHDKVNLNFYLYKAPPACIEYVILHELAHFLYPKHNKDFYDFITIYMPDWKERKRILDHDIVLGI